MPHGAFPLPPRQPPCIIPTQNAPVALLLLKHALLNLMLRHQEHFPRIAAEIVCLDWLAERERFGGILGAEDDHVGEVAAFSGEGGWVWGGVFAEDAAGGEGGFYGTDDEAGRGQEDVTGVVLCCFVSPRFGAFRGSRDLRL
jgi:hypothetical protein